MLTASILLQGYNTKNLTIGTLGGHSALDVCHGAKKYGFRTVCVARNGREQTYSRYFKTRRKVESEQGCIDECIVLDSFEDILNDDTQKKLQSLNTIFIQSRYFWVYFKNYAKLENDFHIPIFGNRSYVKIEERDGSTSLTTGQPYNQYHLLSDAGIRMPKIFAKPEDIDRPVIVKASEKTRGYERAFFIAHNKASWEKEGSRFEREGRVTGKWREATIEEFIVGAPVNFNFFYSPLSQELELMGTDTRRQTNLDGFLRLTAREQIAVQELGRIPLKMIETGHVAVTIKESLVEKAFELGEKFVAATKKSKKLDDRGIIGPFALQGAIVAEEGKEDIVIFDVSMRIPGSPGTKFTPYSMYLHGEPMSYGERIALEIRRAREEKRLEEIVT